MSCVRLAYCVSRAYVLLIVACFSAFVAFFSPIFSVHLNGDKRGRNYLDNPGPGVTVDVGSALIDVSSVCGNDGRVGCVARRETD